MGATEQSDESKLIATRWMPLLVVVMALVAVLFFVIYQRHQTLIQRNELRTVQTEFKPAEADMKAAYDLMMKSVGVPFDFKITKTCNPTKQKISEGDTECSIAYSFSYLVAGSAQAKSYGEGIRASVNNKSGFDADIPLYAVSDTGVQSGQYADLLDGRTSLTCTLGYNLYSSQAYNTQTKQKFGLVKDSPGNEVSVASFECEKIVPQAIY